MTNDGPEPGAPLIPGFGMSGCGKREAVVKIYVNRRPTHPKIADDWGTRSYARCAKLTAVFVSDHVHACHTMTEVHTVSIVPKKMYDGNICSCQAPLARG